MTILAMRIRASGKPIRWQLQSYNGMDLGVRICQADIFISDNGQAASQARQVSSFNEAGCIVKAGIDIRAADGPLWGREDIVMADPRPYPW